MVTYNEDFRIESIFSKQHGLSRVYSDSDTIGTFGNNFFGTLRLDNGTNFWDNFTFSEILSIAMANKKAFYMIYHFNIQGFKTFFNNYWYMKTLNLSKCQFKEIRDLRFVFQFFDNEKTHTVILPNAIPIDTIGEVNFQKITFQPSTDYPLNRHNFYVKRDDLEITILGNYCNFITNPILDLLISYNFMTKLILKKVYLSPDIITCLSGCKCAVLVFIDCLVMEENHSKLFWSIAHIKQLKSLTYIANSAYKSRCMNQFPRYLIEFLGVMPLYFTKLNISIKLNADNVNHLQHYTSSYRVLDLELLTLFNDKPKESIPHYEIIQKLETEKLKVRIRNRYNNRFNLNKL